MGFFSKPKPVINEEDNLKLRELRRVAYMKEAEKIIEEQGREMARNDLGIKQKKEGVW